MNGKKINENMTMKIKNYIDHKVKILEERVYWSCIDIIFEAENYDEYNMDDDNNMYISYSLKKDESIITHPHESINSQIINQYRKNLKSRLMKDDFYVIFEDDEIKIYFIKPLLHSISHVDSDSDSYSNENIILYREKNNNVEIGIININENE